ncbi:RNA polymerase sigma-70 factor [Cohnella lupini]|uniref:RNA polymerase sigma-70 factor n=1 Tax=Cohnella lupini TaxID=1294267 RepID=UPI000E229D06|nr:RNA polymerase sigma-70 factor [Cohnella lupini]
MEELYTKYKNLLFRLAYQLTGSASDAEDIVQDVFVKVHDVDPERLAEPKAYLCRMTTNRSLDLLKSARKKRELYTGPWLPEPLFTAGDDEFEVVERKELLSYAMLVLLERLSPAERAIFVLREALCFEYEEIAGLVGKSEVNCRKIVSRARGKMGMAEEDHLEADAHGDEWIGRFLHALEQGNANALMSLLSEDAVLVTDGGGKVSGATQPILTRERIVRFLFGLIHKAQENRWDFSADIMPMNDRTALVIRIDERIDTVAFLDVDDTNIRRIYFVRNPDKLLFATRRPNE